MTTRTGPTDSSRSTTSQPQEESAPPDRMSRRQRIRRHPLTWFWFAPLIIFVEALFLGPASSASRPAEVSLTAASGVAAGLVYWFAMRRVAGRRMPELATSGAIQELMRGAVLGGIWLLLSVGVITLFGGYRFGSAAPDLIFAVVSTAVAALAGAVAEELAFRGVALQALERLGGSWFALVMTALMFGVAHLANPGASLWSSAAIAIEAGGLLGAAYLWRRNLWFVIGLHAAWNAAEGLLGIPVSGHVDPGLTRVSLHGSSLLTGGSFGLEASVVPVVLSLGLAAVMLVLARRRGSIRRRG